MAPAQIKDACEGALQPGLSVEEDHLMLGQAPRDILLLKRISLLGRDSRHQVEEHERWQLDSQGRHHQARCLPQAPEPVLVLVELGENLHCHAHGPALADRYPRPCWQLPRHHGRLPMCRAAAPAERVEAAVATGRRGRARHDAAEECPGGSRVGHQHDRLARIALCHKVEKVSHPCLQPLLRLKLPPGVAYLRKGQERAVDGVNGCHCRPQSTRLQALQWHEVTYSATRLRSHVS
mmetsp:Transcript_12174/g.36709  ORF Transcript_12174/g.36709 Transcript_12174/m.36709 type:complete len:236 (+) Transcript_12174:22-729(+)